ncbi:putative membrane protein [Ehrlichia chaffeensis str. Liberty]|uniref:Uncharacterized protein n=1 Tax=Ehrlichia chaffeensis (strain ATCC CRL-10679 / Arkansas) TaxID=205920 RepID=Q2GGY6_EHRCR|nr:hypothetical protein ECH_0481 [Ehrlichia chaffeensis str. Arkansas]AHX05701.1 putative membrane protein [Ehrlichia chaffeensis str. Jax]AHX06693.1 putative membrane protein [Ehrlichia chaffeensis str. Liberty]AHX09497.1 putative membrane protein [Ehrlichia chaffeensis str. Wakulla]AHX10570.1 putative membrane protein [Ehrlichia chaffeensis str. West Paces]
MANCGSKVICSIDLVFILHYINLVVALTLILSISLIY